MPEWRNGRRLGLKIPWEQSRAGSSPASGIMSKKDCTINDAEIARAGATAPIKDIASSLGLREEDLEYYGKYKAKVVFNAYNRLSDKQDGKII